MTGQHRLIARVGMFALMMTAVSPLVERVSAADPETVMVTLHAKLGAEAALARVIERHWETARRLNLVQAAPYVTVKGTESENKTFFVIVFTWRDASIPDAAPEAIQAIWKEMQALVEPRAGRPGVDITEVEPI